MRDLSTLFWSKVNIKGPDECWEWLGSRGNTHGHFGTGRNRGFTQISSRMAWILTRGEIQKDQLVCHICNNGFCCNPQHLYLGTPQSNMDDKVKSGRQWKPLGVLHPGAKLAPSQVKSIFHQKGRYTDIARKYGVSPQLISRIKRRIAWSHLTREEK